MKLTPQLAQVTLTVQWLRSWESRVTSQPASAREQLRQL